VDAAVTVRRMAAPNVAAPSMTSRFFSASREEADASISLAFHDAPVRRCISASARSRRTWYFCSSVQNDVP